MPLLSEQLAARFARIQDYREVELGNEFPMVDNGGFSDYRDPNIPLSEYFEAKNGFRIPEIGKGVVDIITRSRDGIVVPILYLIYEDPEILIPFLRARAEDRVYYGETNWLKDERADQRVTRSFGFSVYNWYNTQDTLHFPRPVDLERAKDIQVRIFR